jgi:hypothetical protein
MKAFIDTTDVSKRVMRAVGAMMEILEARE